METSRLEKSFIHSEASLQQLCHQIPENPSQARPGSIEAEDGILPPLLKGRRISQKF